MRRDWGLLVKNIYSVLDTLRLRSGRHPGRNVKKTVRRQKYLHCSRLKLMEKVLNEINR